MKLAPELTSQLYTLYTRRADVAEANAVDPKSPLSQPYIEDLRRMAGLQELDDTEQERVLTDASLQLRLHGHTLDGPTRFDVLQHALLGLLAAMDGAPEPTLPPHPEYEATVAAEALFRSLGDTSLTNS